MEIVVPDAGVLMGIDGSDAGVARSSGLPETMTGRGLGTQETHSITGWNSQIQLSRWLHGYDNPAAQALPGRSGATASHTRTGCLRRICGRVWN